MFFESAVLRWSAMPLTAHVPNFQARLYCTGHGISDALAPVILSMWPNRVPLEATCSLTGDILSPDGAPVNGDFRNGTSGTVLDPEAARGTAGLKNEQVST